MRETARQAVPDESRCVWPGCTRPRAAGRATGSGRQKEYCLQADPPEAGGSPVHNARNRWVALRGAANRAAQRPAEAAEDDHATNTPGTGPDTTGSAGGSAGHPRTGTGGGQSAGSVRDEMLFSATKKRASDLLEQARRQHAAATESLLAERELYQRLGEQLTALADPAALDLEIAAIASRAGASVAQAEEEAARARRAQLTTERERDDAVRLRAHADAAAEQLAADAEAAELALAERTAEFDLDRATFVARAREAEERADRTRQQAEATVKAAEARAGQQAERADSLVAEATAQAEREIAQARGEATAQIAAARAESAAERQAAREDTERARAEGATARAETTVARAETGRAAAALAKAETRAEHATASATALEAEITRLRDERGAELARLEAAHREAVDAARARATRAEDELDSLRAGQAGQEPAAADQ